MAYVIRGGEDLGIAGCEYVASGETPGDVVRDVKEHLKDEHNVDLPETEAILEGREFDETVIGASEDANIIVRRLREALAVGGDEDVSSDEPGTSVPPGTMRGNM